MIDDTPEEIDNSRIEGRKRAAQSLSGSIGWGLIVHDLNTMKAAIEDDLLEKEDLSRLERAKLIARRKLIKELLILPETIINHRESKPAGWTA